MEYNCEIKPDIGGSTVKIHGKAFCINEGYANLIAHNFTRITREYYDSSFKMCVDCFYQKPSLNCKITSDFDGRKYTVSGCMTYVSLMISMTAKIGSEKYNIIDRELITNRLQRDIIGDIFKSYIIENSE